MILTQRELKRLAVRLPAHSAEFKWQASLLFEYSGLLVLFLNNPFEYTIAGYFAVYSVKKRLSLLKMVKVREEKRTTGSYFTISQIDEHSMVLLSLNTGEHYIYKLSNNFNIAKMIALNSTSNPMKLFRIRQTPFIAGIQLISKSLCFWNEGTGELARNYILPTTPTKIEYLFREDSLILETKIEITVFDLEFTQRENIETLTLVKKYVVKKPEDSYLDRVSLNNASLLFGLRNRTKNHVIRLNRKGEIINLKTFTLRKGDEEKHSIMFDPRHKMTIFYEKRQAVFHDLNGKTSEKKSSSREPPITEIELNSKVLLGGISADTLLMHGKMETNFLFVSFVQLKLD